MFQCVRSSQCSVLRPACCLLVVYSLPKINMADVRGETLVRPRRLLFSSIGCVGGNHWSVCLWPSCLAMVPRQSRVSLLLFAVLPRLANTHPTLAFSRSHRAFFSSLLQRSRKYPLFHGNPHQRHLHAGLTGFGIPQIAQHAAQTDLAVKEAATGS